MEVLSAWELYLWTRLDAVKGLLEFLVIAPLVLSIIVAGPVGVGCGTWEKHFKATRNTIGGLLVICFLSICANVAVPSKKDAAIIYVVPKIANNQQLQQEAGEIYTMAKEALRDAIGQDDTEK